MAEVEEHRINGGTAPPCTYFHKFRLYETRSNFYMIGRDKKRSFWRVLKLDRQEPSELNILQDSASYTEMECYDLLRRIHEGNKPTGGLKFVTTCYGIVGFVKFLGPYYMLLITKRRKIGALCGHSIYSIIKSEMIPLSAHFNMAYSKNEKRYKKLLCTVDLTKDFFFSYSYNVMHSLQKNLFSNEAGQPQYETMFVWNEFLTREIRSNLKNTLWTVALVYGFFKQVKLSVCNKNFFLTLIARRSRHFAGTRYLKRGVNEKGRVANDVETEQIVSEDVPDGYPTLISSVVQNRGSIPLFWSQETSRLNLKPDIILSRKDLKYEATRLHFQNLVKRYGNPIIILDLVKTHERKPRETILRAEFANAIQYINNSLAKENRLLFLHWDLNKHSRNKGTNVLTLLRRVADHALNLTGTFCCQVTPDFRPAGSLNFSSSERNENVCAEQITSDESSDIEKAENDARQNSRASREDQCMKHPILQTGVLRTNCIDCLDRTNVAQYVYGLAALGRQLYSFRYIESPSIDLDNPLAEELMKVYETMGDTLAFQYGGSAAHNKIFSQRRGQWKAATQSQEFIRTLQRYYSNAYMDHEKQNAINVFLGHFQPQHGKPALWELDSDQHHRVGRHDDYFSRNDRSFMKRSFSEGNILCESNSPVTTSNSGHLQPLSENVDGVNKGRSESTPEMSTCESNELYSRYGSRLSCRQLFGDVEKDQCLESGCICYDENGSECNCTNFDIDWVSSSGNSCDDDLYDRSAAGLSSENIGAELKFDSSPSQSGSCTRAGERTSAEHIDEGASYEFSESFMNWVNHGQMLVPLKIK